MEYENTQVPFEKVMDAVLTGDPLPVFFLHRLSDMSLEEFAIFRRRWPVAPAERRRAIVRHLADISEESYMVDFGPVFTVCLDDPNADVRAAALEGLWDTEDAGLVEPILRLLAADSHSQVRVAAVRALAHFLLLHAWEQWTGGNVAEIEQAVIAAYLDAGTDLALRSAALEVMGLVNEPEVSAHIEEAYMSDRQELQRSAVFAMGNSADERWLPVLLDEMENPEADLRAEAARAVGYIGDEAAVSQLEQLLYDPEEDVARAAIVALGHIGGEEAHAALQSLIRDRDQAHLHELANEELMESVILGGVTDVFPWAYDWDDDELDEDDDTLGDDDEFFDDDEEFFNDDEDYASLDDLDDDA